MWVEVGGSLASFSVTSETSFALKGSRALSSALHIQGFFIPRAVIQRQEFERQPNPGVNQDELNVL